MRRRGGYHFGGLIGVGDVKLRSPITIPVLELHLRKPQPSRAGGSMIDHTGIGVADVRRSAAFYDAERIDAQAKPRFEFNHALIAVSELSNKSLVAGIIWKGGHR
jgi:hypothetical protein